MAAVKSIHIHLSACRVSRASIFVLPSFLEPFGIVALEAMSCETPVASTHLGGIPEVVKNDENGILVPVNNSLKFDRSNRTIYQRINMSE